jgi:hypothetical protein
MEIDFITAFGRLLRDGRLRDAFVASPQAAADLVQLRPSGHSLWLQLEPSDVESQADVLLQKRMDLVKFIVPQTSRRLGETLWSVFQQYGRINWPTGRSEKIYDTFLFCRYLKEQQSKAVVASEWNRMNFALSKRRAALFYLQMPTARNKSRHGFQFFLRGRNQRWREFFFYLGF